ncbi:MAG: hypothetical protein JW757_13060 [Anaerolineales bacterium]|nr:hypothetical protein [Anaerolineales bacterium]
MEEKNIQVIETETQEEKELSTGGKIGLIIGAIALAALIVLAVIFLLNSEKTPVIRDIFIIALGLELFLIGVAAVLLIFQTTRLINMFQHEIKPVLEMANETMSTIRGTAIFMSDTLVEPVIKFNSTIASFKKALDLLKNITK